MTEQIGHTFTTIAKQFADVYLSEAEVETFPFICYDQTVEESRTKDGVYKLTSNLSCRIVSNNFDLADSLREQVYDAIETEMNNDQFRAVAISTSKDCQDGIWTIELTYRINQFK